jgi:hypothetical protein
LAAKVFKKKAKKLWADRANSLRERVKTVRCADFDTVGQLIAKQLPGAKNTLVRHLANSRLKCATIAFAVAVASESRELLEIRDRLTAQHLKDCQDAADDPRNACTVEGQFLSSTEAQYLTSVAEGITVSFCCRFQSCLWFGLNNEWPKKAGSEHFRCPCCGLLYQPTATGRDRANFSFVLSMPDLVSGEMVHVPASWPDAEDHRWLVRSIEAYAISPSTQAELDAYDLKTATVELHDLLEKVKVPSHFKHEAWDPNGCWSMPADFDLSLYRARGTTFGCKLDRVRDATAIGQPFTQWPLFIAMVGRVVAQTRAGNNATALAQAQAMLC